MSAANDATRLCRDCGKELSDEDLASTDPTRCDSCEQQAAYDLASSDAVVGLSNAEVALLREALDSHIYWQLSDEHYRDSGFVSDPGSDEPDKAAEIAAANALDAKLAGEVRDEAE